MHCTYLFHLTFDDADTVEIGLSVFSLELIFLDDGLLDFEDGALLEVTAELALDDFPEVFRVVVPEVFSSERCSMSSILLSTTSILACFCANFSENWMITTRPE